MIDNFVFIRKIQRGSIFLITLFIFGILTLLTSVYVSTTTTEKRLTYKFKDSMVSFYMAEAGARFAEMEFKRRLSENLSLPGNEVNYKKLEILDFQKAAVFNFTKPISNFYPRSELSIKVKLTNINESGLGVYLDEIDKPPKSLDMYRKPKDNKDENRKLGGYIGRLELIGIATHKNSSQKVQVIKDIKIIDITPPAAEYSLFISGSNVEELRQGTFLLSNWDFTKDVAPLLEELLQDVKSKVFFDEKMKDEELLDQLKSFVMEVDNFSLQNKINNIIINMNPWAKVRTNGRLNVYLPFFEVDDIINYFVDNKYAELPQVGYVNCTNRLHDRYMGKYTRYEGKIYKYYYEMRPYVLKNQKKTEKHKQYTTFSTNIYYLRRNPEDSEPQNLKELLESAESLASYYYPEEDMKLLGTKDNPIVLNGITTIKKGLGLGGYFTGKGMLILKEGDCNILSSLKRINSESSLSLIVAEGKIILPHEKNIVIEGSVYSRNSMILGSSITIDGNYVVENLNRQKGDILNSMPPKVKIAYDAEIRSRMGSNIIASISKQDIVHREYRNK